MAQPGSATRGTQPDTSVHRTDKALDPEHERLDPFVGKWHMEGQQLPGPAGPAAAVSALQTYEWLPGGQFLIHRFDGHIGPTQAVCIEIIGYDAERRCYRAHTFYNNGQTNVWDIEPRGDRWVVLGDWNAGGRALKIRCTTTFADGGQTMNGVWEHSQDGASWQPFWKVEARKVTGH